MFNIKKINKRIAQFRKGKNITRAEIHNKMRGDFKAVGSWASTEAMLDISKLLDMDRIIKRIF